MKPLICLIASGCLLSAQSLQELRTTPEGQIIRQTMRMPVDEAHVAALQAAAASKYAWSHDALELSVRSGGPSMSSQPELSLYHLLTGALVYDVSVENCRHYTPLLARFAKEVPELGVGVTKLLGRANTPESAAALGGLADTDDIAKPASLSNMALSALVDDISEAIAKPVILGLASRSHSQAVRQMATNMLTNLHRHQFSVPPAIQARVDSATAPMNLMKQKSAAELASYVAGRDRQEAEIAVKVLAEQAQQHPREVRAALEKNGLESSLPTVRVRSAAVLLDLDSQSH